MKTTHDQGVKKQIEDNKFLSALVTEFLLSCHTCEKNVGALDSKQTLQQAHNILFHHGFAENCTTHEKETW